MVQKDLEKTFHSRLCRKIWKKRIKKKLADRIFYSDNDHVKSPWNNIGRAHIQLESLGVNLESEGKKDDSRELLMLYKIKDLIEKIENEFGES